MTPIAVTGYQLSLVVHIAAVVVGLGATFAESLMFPVAMSLGARHLPYVHRLQLAINQRLASPALALILATGIYQAADGDWDFGSFWISAAFVIVIALGALNGAYFIPTDRRLGAMVEGEIAAAGTGEVTLSDDYQAQARREGIVGALAGVLVIVAIYLMVVKPGA
jgi:MFS family permease